MIGGHQFFGGHPYRGCREQALFGTNTMRIQDLKSEKWPDQILLFYGTVPGNGMVSMVVDECLHGTFRKAFEIFYTWIRAFEIFFIPIFSGPPPDN